MKFETLEARYVIPEMRKSFSLGDVNGLPRIIDAKRDMIILRGTTDKGVEAYSEIDTTKFPVVGEESTIESWALLKEVGNCFVGNEIDSPREAVRSLGYLVDHHLFKAGFANLYVDAKAIEEQKPLHKFLGGTKGKVEVGISIPKHFTQENIQDIIKETGIRRIKLKVGPSQEDIDKVSQIKSEFPNLMIMVDANSSFNLANDLHRNLLMHFGNLDLLMIEQPLAHNDIRNHIALQNIYNKNSIPGRVCLDESIRSFDDLEYAIDGGIKIINIKVARVGGLDIAKSMIEYCSANNVDTWVGGTVELTAPGKAQSLAMAAHPGVTLPSDISGSDVYYKDGQDPYDHPMEKEKSFIRLPNTVGRGWDVDLDRLDTITTQKVIFQSK